MKKLLITSFLFLTSCTNENICNIVKGMRYELNGSSVQCDSHGFVNTDPIVVCQKHCKGYLNTIIRYGNATNMYSCSCDNK